MTTISENYQYGRSSSESYPYLRIVLDDDEYNAALELAECLNAPVVVRDFRGQIGKQRYVGVYKSTDEGMDLLKRDKALIEKRADQHRSKKALPPIDEFVKSCL